MKHISQTSYSSLTHLGLVSIERESARVVIGVSVQEPRPTDELVAFLASGDLGLLTFPSGRRKRPHDVVVEADVVLPRYRAVCIDGAHALYEQIDESAVGVGLLRGLHAEQSLIRMIVDVVDDDLASAFTDALRSFCMVIDFVGGAGPLLLVAGTVDASLRKNPGSLMV